MVVASRAPMKIRTQPLPDHRNAVRPGGIHPREDRRQRGAAGTQHEIAVHETADGNSRRRRFAVQPAGYFGKSALDVVNGESRATFRIAMQIPGNLVKRHPVKTLVEPGSADSAGSDIETKYFHGFRISESRDRRTCSA